MNFLHDLEGMYIHVLGLPSITPPSFDQSTLTWPMFWASFVNEKAQKVQSFGFIIFAPLRGIIPSNKVLYNHGVLPFPCHGVDCDSCLVSRPFPAKKLVCTEKEERTTNDWSHLLQVSVSWLKKWSKKSSAHLEGEE